MLGNKVVVLGGTGFVGRAVINELSKNGYHTQVVARRPERYRDFALYPNTKVAELADYHNTDELSALFKEADIVVNLISDLTAGTEAIAEKELLLITQSLKQTLETAKVNRVISLSQLGADANNATNQWLCDLGEADAVTLALANGQSTVVRSSLLLGENDPVTAAWRKQLSMVGVLPIAYSQTAIQPLAVEDFAKAFVSLIRDEKSFGKKVEVAGEERMTLKDLAELTAELMDKKSTLIFPMCSLNVKFMSALGALAPVKSVNKIQLLTLCADQISDEDFESRFGFIPKSVEQALARHLIPMDMRSKYHYFRKEAGRNAEELI